VTGNRLFAAVVLGAALLAFAGFALLRDRTGSVAAVPANSEQEQALVRPHSPTKGPESAPVTIVEFLDPECESCRAMHPIVKQVLGEYGDRVRLVIRYIPLHPSSLLAASSLEEVRELGKFDEGLELLFQSQPIWGSHDSPRPELIPRYLAALGIDPARLERESVIKEHGWKIELDRADAARLGVTGTPTFFVNGVMLPDLGYEPLKQAVDAALAAAAGG
jgi:protein-disulfide isomerase